MCILLCHVEDSKSLQAFKSIKDLNTIFFFPSVPDDIMATTTTTPVATPVRNSKNTTTPAITIQHYDSEWRIKGFSICESTMATETVDLLWGLSEGEKMDMLDWASNSSSNSNSPVRVVVPKIGNGKVLDSLSDETTDYQKWKDTQLMFLFW
ncbi:hypothetical protein RIF29_38450 [Crotalaria pallida]|uniref:Uncharacterized protein n=1 Tax=Crotalaria pallida TaxID=3830 RepID=A0AAN9HNS5_CROPI